MSSKQIQPNGSTSAPQAAARFFLRNCPLRVRGAAVYLGVSIQTVYLWVEQKQIPHLARNESEHPFLTLGSRAVSRNVETRGGRWQDPGNMMVLSRVQEFSGCTIRIETGSASENQPLPKTGRKRRAPCPRRQCSISFATKSNWSLENG